MIPLGDRPLNVTLQIDPVALAGINAAWTAHAYQLAYFTLGCGVLIGFFMGWHVYRWYHGDQ